ncbi:MAG: hypothetical protein P8Y58_01795 [Novosphingobium sp.]
MTLAIPGAVTLISAGLALAAIRALLAPIKEATAMLEAVQTGDTPEEIPEGGDDLVGRLLRGVTTAANESTARIRRLANAAERDPFTGVRNRRGFIESAREILLGKHTAVLALIEIDHLPLIA